MFWHEDENISTNFFLKNKNKISSLEENDEEIYHFLYENLNDYDFESIYYDAIRKTVSCVPRQGLDVKQFFLEKTDSGFLLET